MTIVKWVHFAMLNAEELGVTKANVDDLTKSSANPDVRRLLGTEGEYAPPMHLSQQQSRVRSFKGADHDRSMHYYGGDHRLSADQEGQPGSADHGRRAGREHACLV
jgi:hypothetical protein